MNSHQQMLSSQNKIWRLLPITKLSDPKRNKQWNKLEKMCSKQSETHFPCEMPPWYNLYLRGFSYSVHVIQHHNKGIGFQFSVFFNFLSTLPSFSCITSMKYYFHICTTISLTHALQCSSSSFLLFTLITTPLWFLSFTSQSASLFRISKTTSDHFSH